MKRESRAPLIVAIVLLLLPVLYIGSYLALRNRRMLADPYYQPYRFGGEYATRVFWPLEQVDEKLRPGAWGISP